MQTITHSIEIDASAERLWHLTTDIERWPSFFPTVTSVARIDAGPLRVGSSARIKQPGQPERVWTVTACDAPQRFVWETKGLGLAMRATHAIETLGKGRVSNTLTIEVDGPIGKLLGLVAGRTIQNVLATENEGFRAAAARAV
jgi:ribosome-associated toxin RatA of RatAB toxin-antitoxin module